MYQKHTNKEKFKFCMQQLKKFIILNLLKVEFFKTTY